MAVLNGWKGSALVRYGLAPSDREPQEGDLYYSLEAGICEWVLRVQTEVVPILLAGPVVAPVDDSLRLKTPFITSATGTLQFVMFYDDEYAPFGSLHYSFPYTYAICNLVLNKTNSPFDPPRDVPFVESPEFVCHGYITGYELRNQIRGVPTFTVSCALESIGFRGFVKEPL